MKKPKLKVAEATPYEYDICERVMRQLQDCSLHVFGVSLLPAAPAAVGDLGEPTTSILVHFTMLTDGRRGWLVLVQEQDDWDVVVEMTEIVQRILQNHSQSDADFVVRAATSDYRPERADTLDLRDRGVVRDTLEHAYDAAFGASGETSVAGFLEAFGHCGFEVQDELALRRFASETDPPAPSRAAVEAATNGRRAES